MVAIDLEAFEREGYAVVRGFMPRAQTRALRALMDSTLGPPAETVAEHVASTFGAVRGADEEQALYGLASQQPGEPLPPVIDSANYRHSVRHPIRDPLMAEVNRPCPGCPCPDRCPGCPPP